MGSFKECFESYGAEYKKTMERFVHKEEFYVKILGALFQDKSMDEMAAALDQGDLSAAFRAAHSLKGMSGNLGLTFLYNAVSEIVEPLRAADQTADYGELYKKIQAEMVKTEAFYEELKLIKETP